MVPKDPVDVNRSGNRCDRVFGQRNDIGTDLARRRNTLARFCVDLKDVRRHFRIIRPQSLQAIVQVRQIDQRQRWPVLFHHIDRSLSNPARTCDIGTGTPESSQRKDTEFFLKLVAQLRWLAVGIENFSTVRRVTRSRRHRPFDIGIHVVPPEHFRSGIGRIASFSFVIDPVTLNQSIRLPPKQDFGKVAKIPAIANDSVFARQSSGQDRRLCRTRHGRKNRPHRSGEPVIRQSLEMGCVLSQHVVRQTHNIQQQQGSHSHACCKRIDQ